MTWQKSRSVMDPPVCVNVGPSTPRRWRRYCRDMSGEGEGAHPLSVIGAGLPRTGTTSLKAALEQLLGGGCYHMFEFFERVDQHGPLWWRALDGELDALDAILDGWAAAIDWPASLFWRELSERHPDAVVVLSHRGDAETWWRSVDRTVWASMRASQADPLIGAWNGGLRAAFGLGDDWDDPSVAMAAYRRHFDEVVASVAAERLVIWQASDGWEPLCTALGVDVPATEFFHRNTTAEFRDRAGLDNAGT
jgi:hypothetical protein